MIYSILQAEPGDIFSIASVLPHRLDEGHNSSVGGPKVGLDLGEEKIPISIHFE